jgi:hypothetical protein
MAQLYKEIEEFGLTRLASYVPAWGISNVSYQRKATTARESPPLSQPLLVNSPPPISVRSFHCLERLGD